MSQLCNTPYYWSGKNLHPENTFIILEPDVMYIYSNILFLMINHICKSCNFTEK